MRLAKIGFLNLIFALLFISIAGSFAGVPKAVISVIDLILFGIWVAGYVFPECQKGKICIGE